ncbi:MAG: 3,4-dihydroxy-2-butanone-4-phosphate synthase [Gammaproteobacteria bacterium]|nr:MAG: 3,4-dihydroxy-2-butanone-4-phosphate synthase [Gammaproteobacteria bacterium]
MALNTVEEIVEDIRQGKMVIIMDDEDRENEGDLLMAASKVRPEDINFMARYGRGLICLTLTQERCEKLKLSLMVEKSDCKHGTNFTVSIEAAEGVTTGISAEDRAKTVQAAVAPDACADDIVQPGHIFPLMAQPGGVLTRAGHTEAGCDFAKLAGLEPSAVIVEILNEDGTMARCDDLIKFAKEHSLKMGTVADLINYRIANEKQIERIGQCEFPTEYGMFQLITYQDSIDKAIHLALIKGHVTPDEPTLVRVHMENPLCDLLYGVRREERLPLRQAMKYVSQEENGVVLVLRKSDHNEDMLRSIHEYQRSVPEVAKGEGGQSVKLRNFGLGAQILSDLGVKKLRVLGNKRRMHALSGFGIEVEDYVTPLKGQESLNTK